MQSNLVRVVLCACAFLLVTSAGRADGSTTTEQNFLSSTTTTSRSDERRLTYSFSDSFEHLLTSSKCYNALEDLCPIDPKRRRRLGQSLAVEVAASTVVRDGVSRRIATGVEPLERYGGSCEVRRCLKNNLGAFGETRNGERCASSLQSLHTETFPQQPQTDLLTKGQVDRLFDMYDKEQGNPSCNDGLGPFLLLGAAALGVAFVGILGAARKQRQKQDRNSTGAMSVVDSRHLMRGIGKSTTMLGGVGTVVSAKSPKFVAANGSLRSSGSSRAGSNRSGADGDSNVTGENEAPRFTGASGQSVSGASGLPSMAGESGTSRFTGANGNSAGGASGVSSMAGESGAPRFTGASGNSAGGATGVSSMGGMSGPPTFARASGQTASNATGDGVSSMGVQSEMGFNNSSGNGVNSTTGASFGASGIGGESFGVLSGDHIGASSMDSRNGGSSAAGGSSNPMADDGSSTSTRSGGTLASVSRSIAQSLRMMQPMQVVRSWRPSRSGRSAPSSNSRSAARGGEGESEPVDKDSNKLWLMALRRIQ